MRGSITVSRWSASYSKISRQFQARSGVLCDFRLTSRNLWATKNFSHRSYSSISDDEDSEIEYYDFGDYSIVLPPEPGQGQTLQRLRPRLVPSSIKRPSYIVSKELFSNPNISVHHLPTRKETKRNKVVLGSENEVKIRAACRLARDTLQYVGQFMKAGVSTNFLDSVIHEYIISNGAYPSPLGYNGFPNSMCASVNNVIAHGIPNDRPLEEGDILNVDVTVYLDGYHGDTSRMFQIGEIDIRGSHLLETAKTATQVGISVCGPGRPYKIIGDAIHSYIYGTKPLHGEFVQASYGSRPQIDNVRYSVNESFSGHGIGTEFHMKPLIIHTRNIEPGLMEPGDCFTIEPIVLQTPPGGHTPIWIWEDGWTASTENGARGAVFEHTVLITEDGVDVLTI